MGDRVTIRAIFTTGRLRGFVAALALCCAAVGGIVAPPAIAGGLFLGEFAVPNAGIASAGANAKADDATTVTTNPAGMTRLKGNALTLGAGLLLPSVEFDPDPTPISGGDGGEQAGPAPILSSFYAHKLTEDLSIGASLVSFSGTALDPDDDWAGRFFVQEIEFLTITANPGIGYRINDWFSVGAGAILTYAKMEFTLAAPPPAGTGRVDIDADDFAMGYTLSVLFEPSERTRFGILYASEVDLELEGDATLSPPGVGVGIDLGLPLAQTVRGSVYHELDDQWALLGSVAWEDWSTLANQFVSTEAGSTEIPRNWEDVWHFAGGVQYRPADGWMLQGGIAYDTSPVDEEDRTPDLPVDRQIRYAVGAEYDWSETQTIGVSFVYADLGDAEIERTLFSGEYGENHFLFFGLYSKWRW